MNVSRLTFTKETKEKMSKPLNHFQKGELRWKKLKELEDEGVLSTAVNRQDVIKLLGATKTYGPEYTWLSSMISKGKVRETLTGFDKNNRAEYEYHIIGTPDYDVASRAKKSKEAKAKLAKLAPAKAIVQPVSGNVFTVPSSDRTKMVIKYKDLTIELENISQATIEAIVEKLANK